MSKESAEKIVDSLRKLDADLEKISNSTLFSTNWGWEALPLDKSDLRYMTQIIADKIDSVEWEENENATILFKDLLPKIEEVRTRTVANLFSGPQASKAVLSFLTSINLQIDSIFEVEQIQKSLSFPSLLKKNVTATKLRLDTANSSIDGIEDKIKAINRAYDAAERLPITQDEIDKALKSMFATKAEAEELTRIARHSVNAAELQQEQLELATSQAQATLDKLEHAYRSATSQGLAKAFTDKAASLNHSMILWVIVLLFALAAAGLIALNRFPEILAAVTGKPDWGVVLINVILGALSLAPAIWLAWVATKQIGQRFRLSEDYAYKATLSAAYEGYRSEAARLDPLFEARLFSTALGRLDELPLRLVEPHVHGSPWHEFLSSIELKQAVESMPALKERLLTVLRPKKIDASISEINQSKTID